MRVKVAVRAANAERNAEYFHYDRGVTIYTHTADIRLPFAQQVISTNDREALHVIDALCNHETDLQLQEHFVDTHGYTTHVFALCTLLGFRFAPRIRDVLDERLFTVGAPEDDYGPLNTPLKGRVHVRVIEENWDEVPRVAGSIRHGTVSDALLLPAFFAYAFSSRTQLLGRTVARAPRPEQQQCRAQHRPRSSSGSAASDERARLRGPGAPRELSESAHRRVLFGRSAPGRRRTSRTRWTRCALTEWKSQTSTWGTSRRCCGTT